MRSLIVLISVAVLGGCHSITMEAKVKQKPITEHKANSGKTPEVWMAILPADVLTNDQAEWDFVKKHLDGVKFWTQQIDYEAKDWPFQGGVDARGAMEKLVKILNKHKISIIIEKGCFPQLEGPSGMGGESGPFDSTYAQRAAEGEIARLKRYEKIGGKVRFFDVDGPIRHMLHPVGEKGGFDTIEQCAEAFVDYMLLVQKEYPDIEFFALTNFPNWGYRGDVSYWGGQNWGDYYVALEAVTRIAKKKKAPLRGFTIDNPYDYAIGEVRPEHIKYDPKTIKTIDWIERILDVEKHCRKHNLEFNLIFNSQRGGETSAELFNKESLAFIDLYHDRGGQPDRYILQSWYTHPNRNEIVPESNPNTFTGLVKVVIKKVKNVKE